MKNSLIDKRKKDVREDDAKDREELLVKLVGKAKLLMLDCLKV